MAFDLLGYIVIQQTSTPSSPWTKSWLDPLNVQRTWPAQRAPGCSSFPQLPPVRFNGQRLIPSLWQHRALLVHRRENGVPGSVSTPLGYHLCSCCYWLVCSFKLQGVILIKIIVMMQGIKPTGVW